MSISNLDDLRRDHDGWKNELSLGIADSVREEGVDSRNESWRSEVVGSKFSQSVVEVGKGLPTKGKEGGK